MMFDDWRGRLVLFGGLVPGINTQVDETWEFDGSAWQRRTTANRPPARYAARGCFRGDRGAVLMFGGVATTLAGTQAFDDTWEYDGTDWRQVASGGLTQPSQVVFAADVARGTVVAYSGVATHELGAAGWVTVQPVVSPPNRTAAGLGYDPRRRRCVMFAGRDAVTGIQLLDFWEYDGVTWLQQTPVPGPSRPRYGVQMYYDPTARAVLGVGGSFQAGNTIRTLADVLRYEPTVAAESLQFGEGCPGRTDIPLLATSELPWLGRTVELRVAVPAGGIACFVAGLSNTLNAGQPLPQPLAGLGLEGCQLLVSTEVAVVTFAGANGTAAVALAVPNSPALLNAQLFAQAAVPGTGTSSGLVATRGLRLVVGSF
jgi:hypothetical protein